MSLIESSDFEGCFGREGRGCLFTTWSTQRPDAPSISLILVNQRTCAVIKGKVVVVVSGSNTISVQDFALTQVTSMILSSRRCLPARHRDK